MLNHSIPPMPVVFTGFLASLLLVTLAAYISSQSPWLGLQLAYDESRQLPVVEKLYRSATVGELSVGDHLLSISSPNTKASVSLHGFQLRTEPPSFAHYAGHNALLARENTISAILEQPEVIITTNTGNTAKLSVLQSRPISSLGHEFWLFNLFGVIVWNISLVVWAIQPREAAAKLLCSSGAGFFTATFFNSIYKARELALPQDVFLIYSRANHFGLSIMLFSLLALMAYYPRRVTRLSPIIYLIPLLIFYQANESFQWIEWPFHTYYLPVFALYLAGVFVAIIQWRMSADTPLDRAALKWMLLSIFLIMGIGLAIYFVPLALQKQAIVPQWAMVGTASLLYIGFAFGIVRYRLFDVDRWWLAVWAWFLGGLSVVLFDIGLVTLIEIQPKIAMGIAVVAVGWIYFPLRQRVLVNLQPNKSPQLAEQVERIAQAMPSQHTDQFWVHLLDEAYQPIKVKITSKKTASIQLLDNGSTIIAPLLCTEGAVYLSFPNRGRRLFSKNDAIHLDSLLTIAKRILTVHEAEQAAIQRERDRIVRDLHDNVGGHLMTLLRRAPSRSIEDPARKALKGLRESMRILDGNSFQDLAIALEDMRAEVEEILINTKVKLCWEQELEDDSLEIPTRHVINLGHILSEATNNALEHACPTWIRIHTQATEENITLEIVNDGASDTVQDKKLMRGRGLNNISVRSSELGGTSQFFTDGTQAKLLAAIPINQ
ncbi:hypothetical protein [Marinobacter sp.]|uniref:sensor histidine kinase n=1 Tax=Marinobacter sp. TaxID=50741 RepID=UPI002B268FD1|nr:hypothetical protein [Marinobacter sp.]